MLVLLKLFVAVTVEQFGGIGTGIWGIVVTAYVAAIAVGTLHEAAETILASP